MRTVVVAFLIGTGLAMAGSASAQDPAPGRYSMQKSETGIARLDTQTGEVSLCQEKDGQLVCRMAADERAAFDQEIDLLAKRVEALEKAVKSGESAAKQDLPAEEEIDRAMGIMERMMRKFMDIVKDLEGSDPEQEPQKT
ncbi:MULTISPECIES: hypothetical protein [unclassified Ensifer]|uniref:hypothetical protein n=1 Tax=unclassified Ensifer TaxID=2633371 RepID=UPI000812F7B2|nr:MULTISPECIES: hypothetical protein [unclassified Ensifer]OCP05068.1 hypothetical protein BC362_15045 [Ensifer sp. LC14]OCP11773.1 hypothetical protein BC374_15960 [Ensifer sp. LC13]OCP12331.1 hypothetical protein BBX50_16155 [Ensifer sp. LC11]OCP33703.1 hypothetical protein BC364_15685 [Ensifer sp. LC499]